MTIHVDEKVLADKLNAMVDVPYVPEAAEAKAFRLGVEAAAQAIVEASGKVGHLADYGVTVTA